MNRSAMVFMIITGVTITFITVYFFIKVIFSKSTTKSEGGQSWTRVGLVLAMAGNAVGFGNFLRFPVQAVQNGGGAFIIPYLVCFLLMGIPLLLVEWSIGRYGGQYDNHSTPFMLDSLDRRRMWKYIGVFGLFSNIGIAAYYCFMESWTLAYTFHSAIGTFRGMTQGQVEMVFTDYISLSKATLIPFEAIIFFIVCIFLNAFILSHGLKGIEKVAKIGMPLLILFGIILAVKAVTLKAGQHGAINSGTLGLNFLWTPSYDSIWNPKVWLAAAGQIFFTLSVGMGSIQCYSSYVDKSDDIALNSMSAGWMNEFVEVVIGAAIIIPISVGYFGIDKVKELVGLGGLALGFKIIPFLFDQWGPFLSIAAGIMWFLLLFFAGITSSLAMGKPCVSFMEDEFNWSEKKSAWAFGLLILVLGLPTVFFFNYGVFDEYDYWTGTVSLFVFAMMEVILFSWIFGMNKGWKEITHGADINISIVFKYVLTYITPVILIAVFLAALITPYQNDWNSAFNSLFHGNGWPLDNGCIIRQINNAELRHMISVAQSPDEQSMLKTKLHLILGTKLLLLTLFIGIMTMVFFASRKRKRVDLVS
jgi:neurotransmitter:Na+ symporter, NSS family